MSAFKFLSIISLGVAIASPAAAFSPANPLSSSSASQLKLVAQGCPAGMWRGPWGHCRDTPYTGPLPNGSWAGNTAPAFGYFGNGCPPGMWHGPWGHCRDTPYHGRLPNGQWK